jgi:uncharacterized phage protein (TIGR01671 family)
MRELKFRAWNVESGYFTWNIGFQQFANGACVLWENPVLQTPLNKDKFILEQFTGLKDKNGKYIYEGDIIKCPNGLRYEVRFGKYTSSDSIYNFSSYGWYVFGLEDNGWVSALTDDYKTEIVGNIHENPELL